LPGFDDRLKQHLERAAPPADPSGAFDLVLEKKIRRRLMRRLQAAGLAVVVLGATIGGTFALAHVFRGNERTQRPGHISPTPAAVTNGRIAYDHDTDGIWTINPDGTGAENITADSQAANYTPAWSPDGTRIAFIRERNSDPTIYIADADGSSAAPIKALALSNHDLAWAPDGTRIAYTDRGDLFVMNTDGSGSRRVTPTDPKKLDFHPTWSPDGSRIAFARFTFSKPLSPDPFVGQEPSGTGIYVVKTDGSDLTRVTTGPPNRDGSLDEWPDWSPNGKLIVFQRDFEIYVMNADGSALRKLTGGHSTQPSWSPDGMKLVFQREAPGKGLNELYVMDADGSNVTPLDVGPATDLSPDWQPVVASESPSPPPPATPPASPFPARCDASQVTGDFDGDGQPDTATVAKTECFPGEPGGGKTTPYALQVRWPPTEGLVSLPGCEDVCKAVAVTDFNNDKIDELVIKVARGASTDFFQVYELPATEAFGRPAIVRPPGDPSGFPGGEPLRFAMGGSVAHFAALGCWPGNNKIIAEIAELNSQRTEYSVHRTVLRFDPIDASPFGRFTVVSTDNHTEPFRDPEIGPGDRFEPGGPCWMENFSP
jgi:WD40 repeat protein